MEWRPIDTEEEKYVTAPDGLDHNALEMHWERDALDILIHFACQSLGLPKIKPIYYGTSRAGIAGQAHMYNRTIAIHGRRSPTTALHEIAHHAAPKGHHPIWGEAMSTLLKVFQEDIMDYWIGNGKPPFTPLYVESTSAAVRRMYFVEGKKQAVIARELSVSPQQVSNAVRQA